MPAAALGTIVARNYLPFARAFADSVHAVHPDLPVFVVVVDDPPDASPRGGEPFFRLPVSGFQLPGFRALAFGYDRQALVIALKPFLLRALLDRGYRRALFFDADILALGDLAPLVAPDEPHEILLTPHLLAPLDGPEAVTRELNILLSGVYNGGFVGVEDGVSARRFLDWWQDRLFAVCRHDVGGAVHYDQRWLDLVPSCFDAVAIARDPGCNVAYWNLRERGLHVSGSAVRVDAGPCRFFHFSGFNPDRPGIVTGYTSRVSMTDLGSGAALFDRYTAALHAAGWTEARTRPYGFATFENGEPIPPAFRRAYRSLGDAAAAFGDPFRTGPGTFHAWACGQPALLPPAA